MYIVMECCCKDRYPPFSKAGSRKAVLLEDCPPLAQIYFSIAFVISPLFEQLITLQT